MSLQSPVDRAVITSVAAWLPELPPLATTSGMKYISHSCVGFHLASTIAVTAAVPKRIVSHTPRFQVSDTSAASR